MDEPIPVTDDRLKRFHDLLLSWKEEQDAKSPRRRIADAKAALKLGVPQASYTNWLNGRYIPNLPNALILEQNIPGVCEALGYPVALLTSNRRLIYINRGWDYVDNETQQQIFDHVREIVEKSVKQNNSRPKAKPAKKPDGGGGLEPADG